MAGRLHALRGYAAAAAGSTSRSRTPRTSCRWSLVRSESLRRTPSTTNSRASSTASAAVRRGVSSSRRRSRRTASTASAQAPAKVRRYPGLKEEYYLHGFTPDAAVLDELGLDRTRTIVVVRTPPDVSLYHREANPLFGDVLERLGRDPAVHAVVLPRTTDQRAEIAARALPSILVPEQASTRRASSRSPTSSCPPAAR